MEVNAGGNLFFNATVNAGTTLRTGGASANGVIHNGGMLTANGTVELAQGVNEDVGNLTGSGTITSRGTAGTTSTLALRSSSNNTFSGVIQDGADGGATSLRVGLQATSGSISTAAGKLTLSGSHTYTGNTILGQNSGLVSLALTNASSMKFKIGDNNVNTKIVGLFPQATGTVTLDGTFNIDLGSAVRVHNNSWTLVDVTNLNETYGENFNVAAPFAESSAGVWTYNDGQLPDGTWTFTESTGVLTFQEAVGRPPVTTWDGSGTDDLWSNADNWDVEPLTNDDLVFDGSTQTTNTNDLDTGYDSGTLTIGAFAIDSIQFAPTAGAFTLQGNAIDYSNRTITNNSPNTQTFDLQLQIDEDVGGLTVNTAAGDVVINSLSLRNGFGAAITKTGSNKLVINGPLVGADTFSLALNSGSMEVNTNGNLFFGGTIAAGTTLTTGGTSPNGVLHNGASYTVNGTLDLAQSVQEDVGSFLGSGTITNHGTSGTTSTMVTRSTVSRTFSGTIKDGAAGGTTALQVGAAGGTEAGVLTLSGANTYSGDTTLGQTEASLLLSGTGSLRFNPAASGVSNKITGTAPQVTGTVQLDGRFFVDLSGAAVADGNSWTLVDVANLNETFGPTFQLVNSAYVPATTYLINSGTGTFGSFGEDDALATGGNNYSNTNSIDMSAVTNPAPQEVYQSERSGNFTYNFTGLGAGASYKIRLHFAEIYHNTAGARMFNVLINGSTVLSNFDILATAGAKNKAIIQEFTVPANLGGSISVQFVTVTDNAKVSGIEIEPVGGPSGSTFTEAADVWTMVDGANTWTFSEATGMLSISTGGGANYASWASANGIAGQPASGDFDNDGLSNLIEYALGKSPTSSSVPAGSYAGGIVSFSKGVEAVANGDVTWAIQESDDLGVTDAWQAITPTVNNSTTISYTLPTAKPKVFVRLVVEQP
jgi:hypothetical protein